MKQKFYSLGTVFALALLLSSCGEGIDPAIRSAVDNPARPEQQRQRDVYRHPAQTLQFFGLKPDMKIIELWPGAGWYTRILGPIVLEQGSMTAAVFNPSQRPAFYRRILNNYEKMLYSQADLEGIKIVTLDKGQYDIGAADSVDMVLGFRNLHSWIRAGQAEEVLAAIHRVLKPGGTFGLVGHRGDPAMDLEQISTSGYMPQRHAVELVQAAGFRLIASSEINANPKDTRNHPQGVWTLPPSLRLQDVDRDKYLEIGESDRFTLKFIKLPL